MKKILFFLSLFVISSFNVFAYGPQTLTLQNNTSCGLAVYVYATYGSGTCNELMQDLNTVGCATYPIYIGPSSSVTLSNGTPRMGTWWFHGASYPAPAAYSYYYTAVAVSVGYSSWTGSCTSISPCNSYSGSSVAVGIPCSGYPYVYNVTTTPICCGTGASWTDLGFPGSNATVDFH